MGGGSWELGCPIGMEVRVDRVSRVRVARDVISSEPSRTSGILG